MMKCPLLLLVVTLGTAAPILADTIYQTSAQGKPVVIQRDAIVVNEDSTSLVYKHFDLKERRVAKVILSKGSLPFSVDSSKAAGRLQIVDTWKRFGYTATVVDATGKGTRVF